METIKIPRVFIPVDGSSYLTKYSDTEMNACTTSKVIPVPSSAVPRNYRQIFTKGECSVRVTPENVQVGNDQQGITGVYRKATPLRVKLAVSEDGFAVLQEIGLVDPTAAAAAVAGDYKENSGYRISDKNFSLLMYDKAVDPDNDSNTPANFDDDDNAQVLYHCIVDSEVGIVYNGEQGVFNVELIALANTTSTGSAKGKKGAFGTITAAA